MSSPPPEARPQAPPGWTYLPAAVYEKLLGYATTFESESGAPPPPLGYYAFSNSRLSICIAQCQWIESSYFYKFIAVVQEVKGYIKPEDEAHVLRLGEEELDRQEELGKSKV